METFTIRSADTTRLTAFRWEPAGEVRADVLLIHGGFEHLGRYDFVATTLNEAGYRVTGVDLRGHGRSEGKRGHVNTWQDYVDDVNTVRETLEGPCLIVAHSMGGLIALDLLRTTTDVQAAVLSAPLVALAFKAPRLKVYAARVLTRVLPSLHIDNELDANGVSTDPAVVEAYRNDPLVGKVATPRWYTEMTGAMKRVTDARAQYRTPLYVPYGEADPVVSTTGIEAFVRGYGGEARTRPWPGLKHEIFNEPQRAEILADVIQWMDAQPL